MPNDVNCKHYDPINGWCEKLSNFGYPKHFEYCPKSPCDHAELIEQVVNDNDIIKTWEHCVDVGDCATCERKLSCIDLPQEVLNLINRQKAEIEKLEKVNNDLNFQVDVWNPTQTIKDFAAYLCDGRVSNDPVVIAVKCAVQEMTEEKE